MLRFLAGIFVILHGLVHLWLVTLSLRLGEFKTDMGWTGESWLLSGFVGSSPLRIVASAGFILATLLYLVSGVGVLAQADWTRTLLLVSAAFSSLLLLIFWDGNPEMIVQKGLIGLLINIAVVVVVLMQR